VQAVQQGVPSTDRRKKQAVEKKATPSNKHSKIAFSCMLLFFNFLGKKTTCKGEQHQIQACQRTALL